MPHCKKCGLDHYNFQACEVAQARGELAARRDRAPRMVLREREGFRDFGNVTYAFQPRGINMFIPRTQHPAYEAPVKPAVEAHDFSHPPFFDEAA